MASLQPAGSMLETSCGSPHYACPEVIRVSSINYFFFYIWAKFISNLRINIKNISNIAIYYLYIISNIFQLIICSLQTII